MYQATIARVATVALAAAAFPAASASAAAHAENSASSHAAAAADHPVGTPVAAADAVPTLTVQEKNARVREATRNLYRKSAEHKTNGSSAGSDSDTPASKAERRRRAAEESRKLSPESGTAERLSAEEVGRLLRRAKEVDPDGKLPQHQWMRRANWWNNFASFGDGIPSDYRPYQDGYADSGYEWDMWAQGYRMLGGFIDCDWQQGEDEPGGGGDAQRQRRNAERDLSGDNTEDACGRWMMWAAVSQVLFVACFALLCLALFSLLFSVGCGVDASSWEEVLSLSLSLSLSSLVSHPSPHRT